MTERERDLLQALAEYDDFKTVLVLMWKHPHLKAYTKHELFSSATSLVHQEMVIRTMTNPEREAKYRITAKGHEFLLNVVQS